MLRTDYKDEVLPVGQPYRKYNIIAEDGRVIQSDIHLEKSYVPEQKGDTYGAGDINELNVAVNGLYPPNLLVNGDFLINQRAESVYNKNHGYTLDMWYNNNLIVTPLSDGWVRLENDENFYHAFQQSYTFFMNKEYTLIVNTRNITGSITVDVDGESVGELSSGLNKFTFSNKEGTVFGINIRGMGSVEIEYVDLHFGAGSYEHVPEDIGTAKTKCQRYLQVFDFGDNVISLVQHYTTPSSTNGRFRFPIEMASKPTITIVNSQISPITGPSITSHTCKVHRASKDLIEFMFTHNNTRENTLKYMYVSIIATCEPL